MPPHTVDLIALRGQTLTHRRCEGLKNLVVNVVSLLKIVCEKLPLGTYIEVTIRIKR